MIKHLKACRAFVAGDGCVLREILNARKAPLKLRYSLAHARVGIGKKTRPHRLKSSEVYYILRGSGRMNIDRSKTRVRAFDTVYIPPKSVQWIENIGRTALEFLCIVDPAWQMKDEQVLRNF